MMERIIIPILIPLGIIMIIIYFKMQRLFSLAFSVSALTYIITMLYAINEFNLEAGIIFLLLLFSALFMIAIGFYLNHQKNGKKKRK